jgi:aspartate/methionine/tyrosine aminotransferase
MAGVTAALHAENDGLQDALAVWQQRRDTMLDELNGLPVIPPHGGWSMLLDTELLGVPAAVASEKLFKKAKIAATPMIGWGDKAARYVRFVFSNETQERLVGMGAKVRKALST